MKREDRLREILELLDQQERIEVDDLARQFSVSPETIRRDLSTLSERGLLRKVHGGAVKFQTAQEHSFTIRTYFKHDEKTAIARAAASFVSQGDSLFINAGTTTAVFARELARMVDDLTIITNSAIAANELWNRGRTRNKIYLLGGSFNGEDAETIGPMLIEQIQQFQTDHAFLTVGALSADGGFMEYRVEAAHIIRTMIHRSHRATVMADGSKLDRSALVKACDFSDVQRLVTDTQPSTELAEMLTRHALDVCIAPPVGS